jgi:REP element-mobilizing transposase RayT
MVDYSLPNYFFITICTYKYGYYFEKYPELKKIIKKNILNLNKYYSNIEIKEYVIMPNHIHMMLAITYQIKGITLGKVIATLKSKSVIDWLVFINQNKINERATIWQRNYYEHIIRDEKEKIEYRGYIKNNPKNWLNDSYHVSLVK